ncbi:MAG: single-stranded DNA-binding protein [Rhodospirillales bacterium]|nr:single-stranded DNA-binding protein [Rhodospirillales bacterium]
MAGSKNKVTLLGRVGIDPEIRTVSNGNRVASFSLATSDTWRDSNSGERVERTEWHRIVVWNQGLVKVVEKYVTKGSLIDIEGKLRTRKWVDNAGNERYTTEIHLENYAGELLLLESASGNRQNRREEDREMAGAGARPPVDEMDRDEIPF